MKKPMELNRSHNINGCNKGYKTKKNNKTRRYFVSCKECMKKKNMGLNIIW